MDGVSSGCDVIVDIDVSSIVEQLELLNDRVDLLIDSLQFIANQIHFLTVMLGTVLILSIMYSVLKKFV